MLTVTQSKKFPIFYGTSSFITMMTQIFWDINTVSLVKSSLRWLDPLKHHELCTQWYSRTPQKTWIFTVRTLEFVFITMLTRSHHLNLFKAASHTTSERSILISYSCPCYASKMVFSHQVFRVKFDIHFSSPPCVLHDTCITRVCHTLEMAQYINNSTAKVTAIQQIVCNERKNLIYNSWSENKTITAILL
jgi:hypothetical protein